MENLAALVRELCKLPAETEWVEFKESNCDPDMVGRDVSALSNGAALLDKPFSYMLWGIGDATHEVVGTSFNWRTAAAGPGRKQELDSWLRLMLSDNTEMEFLDAEVDGLPVVILRISRATARPVAFKRIEYVRVGSYTKKLADVPSRQTALWDKLRSSRFELGIAAADLSVEDVIRLLDVQSYFDGMGRPLPSTAAGIVGYLEQEDLVSRQDNGLFAITNAGASLFAKGLADFRTVRRKAVRIVRYYGGDRSAPSKEEVYGAGYAVDFEGLIRLIGAMTPSEETVGPALREESNGYPSVAVREVVANALIHQDFGISGAGPMVEIFDHRMEVTNPGAPMVDTMRIIDAPPCSRNESIASLMRRMRVCEEKGSGWDKIALSCEKSELPSPTIRAYERSTRVVLYTWRPFSEISAEEREWACYMHACLSFVDGGGCMTNRSLRRRFGEDAVSQATASKLIRRALGKGLIRPLDPEAAPRYMRYVPAWA